MSSQKRDKQPVAKACETHVVEQANRTSIGSEEQGKAVPEGEQGVTENSTGVHGEPQVGHSKLAALEASREDFKRTLVAIMDATKVNYIENFKEKS